MSTPKWNDIPFNEDADAATKADEFDKQYEENGGGRPTDDNPYSQENFPPVQDGDRRK